MTVIHQSTPMLPIADMEAACAFMRDCLGFVLDDSGPTYRVFARGGGRIGFVQAPPDADMDDPNRQVVVYVDASDVDSLYEAHKPAIDALPEAHRKGPLDRDYGQRELHLIHGPFLYIIGHPLPS